MKPGEAMAMVARPAVSGSLRARQAQKDGIGVTKRQWLGFIAVAAFTTWLTQRLDDLVEQRLGDDVR